MQWIILEGNGEKVPAKRNVIFRQKGNTRSALVEFTHSEWEMQIAKQFQIPFHQIEFLDESTPTVPGSVEDAAKEYINCHLKTFGEITEQVDLFAAGAKWATSQPSSPVPEDVKLTISKAYLQCECITYNEDVYVRRDDIVDVMQELFAGHAYKGQPGELKLTDDVGRRIKEKSDTWNEEIKPHFARGMAAGYNMAIHDASRLNSQPIPLSIVEELNKLNPQNSDGTDTEWYKYYGTQVTGEGKESYVHSGACLIACKMAEQELFKKVLELLQSQPPAPIPVDIVNLLKECDEYLSQHYFEKGKPVYLNNIGANSILHKKMQQALSSYRTSVNNEDDNNYKLPGHDETINHLDNLNIKPK